jgi:hypothetical protein
VSRTAVMIAGILLGVVANPAPGLVSAPARERAAQTILPAVPQAPHRLAARIHAQRRATVADFKNRVVASSVLAPGVSLHRIRRPTPPQQINVIVVTPQARIRAVLVQAGPDWAPFATVSSAVRRTRAMAGINGTAQGLFPETPMLVRESQIVSSPQAGLPQERHPRTGVGLTLDGSALFVTVDGRRATAAGMTLREFAILMRALGAVWAVNLDGGASTTMVVRGKVRNSPSDPYGERLVPNAVVLLSSGRPGIVHLVSQLREWDKRITPAGRGPGRSAGRFDGFRGEG